MKKIIMLMGVLTLSFNAWGQLQIEPGLWKLNSEISLGQGDQKTDITTQLMASKALIQQQMQEVMKKADEKQKAMMQDAMGAIGQASETQTYCLTQEEIEKGIVYSPEDIESCKIKKNEMKKKSWHLEMDCKDDKHEVHIVMDGVLQNSKNYTIASVIQAGKQTMTTKHVGTFVSKNCAAK